MKKVRVEKKTRFCTVIGMNSENQVEEKTLRVKNARTDAAYLKQFNVDGFTPCKVVDTWNESVFYEMDIEDFYKYATLVTEG